MTAGEGRIARRTALTVGALVLLRLVVAAVTPLAFDEAYYWTWSRSLAGGYYDHPPMVAVLIRLGTSIFGDTEFGVRVAAVLLAVPMSWAVYRTTQILFGDARMAATAVIMLNATLMVAVGTIIVTPDAPLLLAAALVLYALARLHETGRGTWWLAVGVAVGFGLLSKYTAFFFGAEIPLWLLLVKRERRWLLSPWPYLGGVVALALFAPVIVWNAEHHWVSFIKQFGRARADGFTLRYLLEIIPAQIAFATPSVFILGALGLAALLRKNAAAPAARALINVSVWTLVAYFAWHSLHQRVEANWLGPVYPAFAVAAAYAVWGTRWQPRAQRLVDLSQQWALPLGVVFFIALVVQANTGVLTAFRSDPSVRVLGVGWPQLARDLETIRAREGATCILTQGYPVTAWLIFYAPRDACIAQRDERYRWTHLPQPSEAQLKGPLLLFGGAGGGRDAAHVTVLPDVARRRSGVVMQTFGLAVLAMPAGDVLDRAPPPEVKR
jgi:4-amino-4-deoxy-L-arabinose transferase-like glycosyltransferase